MISQRQQDANRRNASKSHGPTTPEGLAAVRMNALKHGFTAAEIILPTVEEKIDFEQFRFAFESEYNPVGPTEEVLVEDMVISRWRLNRIRKMEPGFFARELDSLKENTKAYFSHLDPQAHLAHALSHDAFHEDVYGKMSRYEGRFERTFYKALKELQRLQALRAEVSDSGNGTVSQSPVSPVEPADSVACRGQAEDPPLGNPVHQSPDPSVAPPIHSDFSDLEGQREVG
jgi:hypothetical protein